MTENSFDKIKKLIKIVGGKVVIVEDGKPTMVIINIDEYVDFDDTENNSNSSLQEKKEIVRNINRNADKNVNRDINIWKNKQEERMVRQFEIENKYKEKRSLDLEDVEGGDSDEDEIVIEKL